MLRLIAVVLMLLTSSVLGLPQLQRGDHDHHMQQEKPNLTALEGNELTTGINDDAEQPLKIQPVIAYPWGSMDGSVHSDDVLQNTSNTEDQSFTTKLATVGKQADSSSTEKGSPDMIPAANNLSGQMEISTEGELNGSLKLEGVPDIHQLASNVYGQKVKVAEKKQDNSSHKKKESLVKQSTERSVSQTEITTDKMQDSSSHQHGNQSTSSPNVEMAKAAEKKQNNSSHKKKAFPVKQKTDHSGSKIVKTTEKKQDKSSHQHGDLSTLVQSTSSSNVEMEQTTERTSAITSGKQVNHTDVTFTPTISSTVLSTLMEQTTERTSAVTSEKQEDHTDVTVTPTISSTNLSTLMEQTTERTSAVTSGKQEDHTDTAFIPTISATNLSTVMEQTAESTSIVTSGKQEDRNDAASILTISSTNFSTLMEQTTERTSADTSAKLEDHTDMTSIPTISSSSTVISGKQEDYTDTAFIPTISSSSTVTSAKQEDHADTAFIPTISSTNLSTLMEQTTERTSTVTFGKQEDLTDMASTPAVSSSLTVTSGKQEDLTDMASIPTISSSSTVTSGKQDDHTDAASIPTISSTNLSTLMEQTTEATSAVTSQKQEDHTDTAFNPTISSSNLSTLMETSTKGELNSSLELEDVSDIAEPAGSFLGLRVQMQKTKESTSTVTSRKQEDHTGLAFIPTISSTNLSTRMETSTKGGLNSSHKLEDVSDIAEPAGSLLGLRVQMEQDTERTSIGTSRKREDHTNLAFIPTISSTNLSTRMETSTKGELTSSLKLEDVSDIAEPAGSLLGLRVQMGKKGEKEQDNSSHIPKEFLVKHSADHSVSKNEITAHKKQDPSFHQHGDLYAVVQTTSSSNVEVKQTTERTPAVTSQKQEDHTDAASIPTISSTNLSTLMETATKGQLNNLLKLEDVSDSHQSASGLRVHMVKISEKKQDNSSDEQKEFKVKHLTYPSVSKIVITTDKKQDPSSHQYGDLSVAFQSIIGSNLEAKQTAQRTIAVTSEEQEDEHDVAFRSTFSSTDLSVLAEVGTEKDQNESSLKHEVLPHVHHSTSSPTVQAEQTTRRNLATISHEQEHHTDEANDLNISTQVKVRAGKLQNNSSRTRKDLPYTPRSASSKAVQVDPTDNDPEGDSSHKVEISSVKANNSLNISTSDLNGQMDTAASWDLMDLKNIPEQLKDLFILISDMNFTASDVNKQVYQSTIATVPKRETLTEQPVPKNLNTSASNLEIQVEQRDGSSPTEVVPSYEPENMNISIGTLSAQMELATDVEQDNLSHKQKDLSDIIQGLNVSASNINTQMDLTTTVPQHHSSHKMAVQFDFPRNLNISDSHLYAQVDDVAVQNKQDKSSQKQVDPSASSSNVQMEVAGDVERDILSPEQSDTSAMHYNLNISDSNIDEKHPILPNTAVAPEESLYDTDTFDDHQDQILHFKKQLSRHLNTVMHSFIGNRSKDFQMEQDKSLQKVNHDSAPVNMDLSASNLDVQIMDPADKEKDNSRQQENFYDMPFDLDQSAINMNEHMMEPINEDEDNSREGHSFFNLPTDMDQSASFNRAQVPLKTRAMVQENKDVTQAPLGQQQPASKIHFWMQGESQEDKDLYNKPFGLNQSASNVNFGMSARFQETKDLNGDYDDVEGTTRFLPELGIPREVRKYKDRYDEPFSLGQSASKINVELPAEDYEDTYLTESPSHLKLATSNVYMEMPSEEKEVEAFNEQPTAVKQSTGNVRMAMPAEEKRFEAFNPQPIAMKHSTSNVRMEMPAEPKEYEAFNPQPIAMSHYPSNVRMEQTTEVGKRGRFHIPETFHNFGLPAKKVHVPMEMRAEPKEYKFFNPQPIAMNVYPSNVRVEQTTEVGKRARFHIPEEFYDFLKSAKIAHVPVEQTTEIKQEMFYMPEGFYDVRRPAEKVHVPMVSPAKEKWSNPVKPHGFNKNPSDYDYSASNINMQEVQKFKPEIPLEYDDFDEKNQPANYLKVQYLVMSFNESNQTTSSRGRVRVPELGDALYIVPEENITCPAEYAIFPDPNGDCNAYYVCHNWTKERKACSRDLHFNPISRVCDYPGKAVCDLKCLEQNERYPVPGYCNMYLDCSMSGTRYIKCSDGLHYNAVTKQCDSPAKAACEITCGRYNTLVPLPGRCNMYVHCEEGNATYHLCPPGLHFNPVALKCDIPETEECTIECLSANGYFPVLGQCNNYIECRNNHGKVVSCPSGLHFNFLLQTCDIPSQAGCEMKCKEPNGYFPFPGVCSYFIMCLNGTPFLKKCPGDLEFNEDTNQCDIVSKNHCLPYCPRENGIFPVDNHCDLYMRCTHGQPLLKRCPPGLHFNALFKHCDLPENAKCEIPCPVSTGTFPLPGKCNKFMRCENGTSSVLTCAQGLHFNARTQTCDWPPAAQCEISCPEWDGYFAVQGACNAYVVCTEGRPTLRKCPHGKHFNLEAKHCDYPDYANCQFVCPESDGLYPYRGHCDSYIHCEDGKPHIDSCPPGLLFNILTFVCDLAENVHCYI